MRVVLLFVLCCIFVLLAIVATVVAFFGQLGYEELRKSGGHLQYTVNKVINDKCGRSNEAVFDPDELPWAVALQKEWRVVRDELAYFERGGGSIPKFSDIDPLQGVLDGGAGWRTLWLMIYGRETAISSRFPKTMALVRQSQLTSAMLSVMPAKSVVPPHHGDFKGILRYTIPLEIPKQHEPKAWELVKDCVTCVGNECVHDAAKHEHCADSHGLWVDVPSSGNQSHLVWEEGQHFLFDDMMRHYVSNQASERRVIFFGDVPRSDCGWRNLFIDALARYGLRHFPRIAELGDDADRFTKNEL